MASLSGTLATMGPGVPYAIAAKFAHPDRPVIALVGDGAMQMNGNGELVTIAKYWQRWSDPRLVVLVLHNNDLNQVTWEQRAMEGDPRYEASQQLPDFPYARYAELIGLRGIRVDDPDQVADAWEQALTADRPVVLEAITDPEVPPLPPHITLEQAKALTLGTGARRPERRPDRQAGRQGQARRVPARPMIATQTTMRARGVTGPTAVGRGLHRPDRRSRGRRHVRLGRDDDRRRARRGGRRAGHRLHLRRPGHGAAHRRASGRRGARRRRARAAAGVVGDDPRGAQPRPPRRQRDGDQRRRRRAVGPQGPAARPAARHAAGRGARAGPGLWQRRVHQLQHRAPADSSWPAGCRRASRA